MTIFLTGELCPSVPATPRLFLFLFSLVSLMIIVIITVYILCFVFNYSQFIHLFILSSLHFSTVRFAFESVVKVLREEAQSAPQ